jgi:cell wall-associated NlpC family hydrolase
VTYRVHPRHAAPTIDPNVRPVPRLNSGSRRLAGIGLLSLAVAGLLSQADPAAAATVNHNPIGALDSASSAGTTGILVQGWTGDPDMLSKQLTVMFTLDGAAAGRVVTSINRSDATKATGVNAKAGFASTLVATPGSHRVCAIAGNWGPGASVTLGCRTATVTGPSAANLAAHYPAGVLDGAVVTKNTVAVRGWAMDPDAPSTPLTIRARVDGVVAPLTGLAAVSRPDVAAAKHAGPKQGFQFSTVLINGSHELCVEASNVGLGGPNTIFCTRVQIGPPAPTAAQVAAQSPAGTLEVASAVNTGLIRVRGWTSDPNNRMYPVAVVGYIDGQVHTTYRANLARPDLATNKAAGPNSGFSIDYAVGSGAHNVCLWAVNIGVGSNKLLGCKSLTTVGITTGPRPATPASNTKITAAAKKFLGGKYVWGAEDPKVGFDCSGLVQYTYRGAGLSTPRVAQDQFRAARMISASRAVPGDLVFYHDAQGSVYHVGIYVSPGVTYAAVDEAEGIRVQQIWDPSATYGSFTHS